MPTLSAAASRAASSCPAASRQRAASSGGVGEIGLVAVPADALERIVRRIGRLVDEVAAAAAPRRDRPGRAPRSPIGRCARYCAWAAVEVVERRRQLAGPRAGVPEVVPRARGQQAAGRHGRRPRPPRRSGAPTSPRSPRSACRIPRLSEEPGPSRSRSSVPAEAAQRAAVVGDRPRRGRRSDAGSARVASRAGPDRRRAGAARPGRGSRSAPSAEPVYSATRRERRVDPRGEHVVAVRDGLLAGGEQVVRAERHLAPLAPRHAACPARPDPLDRRRIGGVDDVGGQLDGAGRDRRCTAAKASSTARSCLTRTVEIVRVSRGTPARSRSAEQRRSTQWQLSDDDPGAVSIERRDADSAGSPWRVNARGDACSRAARRGDRPPASE